MRIELATRITAADETSRTISGRVVTWGEQGRPGGVDIPVVFEPGSLKPADDVVFRLEHDRTRPIGRPVSFSEHSDGIDGVFRVIATRAGDDSLIEAAEGLRGGLSVGASIDKWEERSGVLHVLAAVFDEVSLVSHPALDSSRVERVAASDTTQEETLMDPNTDPIEVEEVEEVEESDVVVTASAAALSPVVHTRPRATFGNPADYAVAYIAAQNGDREAAMKIRAANQTIADNPGIIPTEILGPVITFLANSRPVMSAGRSVGMPSAGASFIRPKVTTHTLVGKQAKEIDPLASQTLKTTPLTVTKSTYGGTLKISFQDAAWSTPGIMGIVIEDLARTYAMQTESATAATLVAGVTKTVPLAADAKSDAVIGAIAGASKSVWDNTYLAPDTIFLSTDQWQRLVSLCDTTGRPLFPTLGAMNAPGTARVDSLEFSVMGLRAVVSYGLATGSMIVGHSSALEVYEQQGGQLSLTNVTTLSTDVAFYGYQAALVTEGAAFCSLKPSA